MKYAKCITHEDSMQFDNDSAELRKEIVTDIKKGSDKVHETDDFSVTMYSLLQMTLSAADSSPQNNLDSDIAVAGLKYREPETPGDGNCLFHGIAEQLRMHGIRGATPKFLALLRTFKNLLIET